MDNEGRIIVRYEYAGYGNQKSYVLNNNELIEIKENVSYTEDGLRKKFIESINPFRYRGYYYDRENNLYYLISRYYDPSKINGLNMIIKKALK